MKVLFFLSLFLMFFITACTTSQKENAFEFYKVKTDNENSYSATVQFQYKTNLSFQIDGRIIYIPYTKGDFIKKGQIVAKLDDILYKIKKAQEEQKLQETRIKYNQSKSYFKRMDILHKAGAVSDNDWEDADFSVQTNLKEIQTQEELIRYLNEELKYSSIIAPYDGYIFEKKAELGAYLKAGETVFSFIGSIKTQIETMVSSDVVNDLYLKQKITAKRNNVLYNGEIEHISKSSTDSGGYLVKILLDKFYDELKEGMNLDVEFIGLEKDKIYIPLESVKIENDKYYVFKIKKVNNKEGIIKKTQIKTNNIANGKIEVLEGIQKDDLIILKKVENAKDNLKIKL